MYGGQMQAAVPQYLEASLDQFQRNQSQLREAMAGAFAANPFAEGARRKLGWCTGGAGGGRSSAPAEAPAEAGKPAGGEDTKAELAGLKAQLAELQKQLDRLSQ
jgi:polyhydroxyalkanoate synthesis regulator protein